jgi:hypothetical protein
LQPLAPNFATRVHVGIVACKRPWRRLGRKFHGWFPSVPGWNTHPRHRLPACRPNSAPAWPPVASPSPAASKFPGSPRDRDRPTAGRGTALRAGAVQGSLGLGLRALPFGCSVRKRAAKLSLKMAVPMRAPPLVGCVPGAGAGRERAVPADGADSRWPRWAGVPVTTCAAVCTMPAAAGDMTCEVRK